MTIHQPITAFIDARAVDAPVHYRPNRAERAFELHPAVFGMLAASFALFMLALGVAFMNPTLIVPFGICAAYLLMFFGVPLVVARTVPGTTGRFQSWAEFMAEGVETGSGHLTGAQALAQIMTVPAVLVGFAVTVAIVRAAV
ncbi:hypothetical protein [Sphingomonas lenta]|uniref:Uncharacterized protein n=1 Tax=Sphingomonas lenta TaxID=1141887 RepID=A0A2A2SFJ5_9SPHN|nr:hypothetical protein [Sphingomonas lenta]PAX08019.1 hypothetical protein CKY28_10495 [Sphingomonas lenta]